VCIGLLKNLDRLWLIHRKEIAFHNMHTYYSICALLIIGVPLISSLEDDNRNEKLISSFQIVKFPNDACEGTGVTNGTCYTSQECADKGGTSSGSCADGFGVCCTFVVTSCGSTTSENLTQWTLPDNMPDTETACSLSVCPKSDDICSLRLDFTTFIINGPSTVSVPTQVRRRLGTPVGSNVDNNYAAQGTSYATNCLLDLFSVTSASTSTNPPGVCGTLTGEHMYVEADTDKCNMLHFNLAATNAALPAAGQTNERGVAAGANRNWDIKITQIECTSELLPPPGCTKYYWSGVGAGNVVLTNYNFGAGAAAFHLGNQHERFCVRRERGNCIGCFIAANVGDVQISGLADVAAVYTQAGGCCGYHTQGSTGATGFEQWDNTAASASLNAPFLAGDAAAGSTQMGFDCLIIPGAFAPVGDQIGTPNAAATVIPITAASTALLQQTRVEVAGIGNVPSGPQICGQGAGLGIGAATVLAAAGDFGNGVFAAGGGLNAPITAGTSAGGNAANMPICTRNVPFTLEFMSDDLEGLGATAGDSENVNAVNRGFTIQLQQLACT